MKSIWIHVIIGMIFMSSYAIISGDSHVIQITDVHERTSCLQLLKRPCIEFGGVNRLGDGGVNTLGDTSAFVNPTVQLLLTRRGKTRMDGVGIVFEFYIAPL